MPRIIQPMTEDFGRAVPTPSGWLMNPGKKRVMFFIRDPKSLMRMPKVITQLWYATEDGVPTKLKNTRSMDIESAYETWNELLSNDWELVEHQINEDVA